MAGPISRHRFSRRRKGLEQSFGDAERNSQGKGFLVPEYVTRYHYNVRSNNMNCPKCKGRMYTEKYNDFVRFFDAWKCSCCGELIDSTILLNRKVSLPK